MIQSSDYHASGWKRSAHLQTMFPALFRKIPVIPYERERVELPDGDFVDVDWSRVGGSSVVIVLHGLEGMSTRGYVMGMVRAVNAIGLDAVAMNFRSCSGEMNRLPRFYHSGDTEDLRWIVSNRLCTEYSGVSLIGFSMGGNVILKYLGEEGVTIHPAIRRAVAFSVPCYLPTGAAVLDRPSNFIYLRRFLNMLKEKIRRKAALFPGELTAEGLDRIRNFEDFDNRYTAPLHGFRDAMDYWEKSSCIYYLKPIAIPTLIVNAANDPFLSEPCYPVSECRDHDHVILEMPRWGGHVGFIASQNYYWSERRTVEFLQSSERDR